jgi:hypothetical protein
MTDPRSLSPLDLETPDKTFLDANELVINMGPQHPATHGVLRVILRLDGEKVMGLECVIGYLHRGVEKIAEEIDVNNRGHLTPVVFSGLSSWRPRGNAAIVSGERGFASAIGEPHLLRIWRFW